MLKERCFRIAQVMTVVAGVAMVIYQLVITQYLFLDYDQSKILHLGFALVLALLPGLNKKSKHWWFTSLLVLCSIAVTTYYLVSFNDLIMRIGLPELPDIIAALVVIAVTLETTRRAFGLVLPIFCFVWFVYAFVGHLLPGALYVPYFSAEQILTKVALDFTGIYGEILGISVSYIFLFIIFGTLMKETGTVKFFEQIGRLTGRTLRGGTAMSCISTSALFGMVTGSASSNVVLTGSFTIPAMKRAGFTPEQAGGIEAAASTVGQVMPPVMGAAAFLMANFVEVPYAYVCWMAVLPSLLTYFSMAVYAQFQAMRNKISPPTEKIDFRQLLGYSYLFVLPLFTLVFLLAKGYSPNYAVFWTIVLLVILSLFRQDTRLPLKTWVDAMVEGAIVGSGVSVMCAATGIVVAVIIMSGLAIKLPAAIQSISGGNVTIVLVLTMFVTLVLGCGMPTTAAYMLVALVVAPALTKSGVNLVAAHFFVFYYACFSLVTPPVAPAAVTAAAVARSKFFKTGVEATKVSAGAFILPFFMLSCPVLFLKPENFWKAFTDLGGMIVLLVAVQVALVGYYITRCNYVERLFMGGTAACMSVYLYRGDNLSATGVIALAAFLLFSGFQYYKYTGSLSAVAVDRHDT